MNKKDLRLGNLVEYPCWNKDGTSAYFKVRDIFWEDDKLALTDGIIQLPQTRLEYIRPILITKEWLDKFGFQNVYRSKFRLKFDHKTHHQIGYDFSRVLDKSMEGFRFYGHYIKIEYVHQLQNLYFALTGIELDAAN